MLCIPQQRAVARKAIRVTDTNSPKASRTLCSMPPDIAPQLLLDGIVIGQIKVQGPHRMIEATRTIAGAAMNSAPRPVMKPRRVVMLHPALFAVSCDQSLPSLRDLHPSTLSSVSASENSEVRVSSTSAQLIALELNVTVDASDHGAISTS